MAEDKTELYILKGLLHMPDYASKYIDKMEEAYFSPAVGRVIRGIKRVWMAHKKCPTNKMLCDMILPKVCRGDEVACEESIDMPSDSGEFYDWLVDETKKFIKRSRIEMALVKCVELMDSNKMDAAVQEIINANNVSFDESLGLDYFEDLEKRMTELRNPASVIDTGIEKLNRAIGGGWRSKSLTIFGVDYIGLMTPNGKSFSDNTYGKLKTVSEELRAIAVKLDVPIFSAVQVNRDGYNSSHVGLENTADSIGIPATADLMITVCRDDESDSSNKMYWYVAKSRFSRNGDQFMLDVDYDHMRVYDSAESSNEDETMKDVNQAVNMFRNRKNTVSENEDSDALSDTQSGGTS
jgi:hypothetical protein